MREIKFRAWDGEQMVSPDYIDRNGAGHWSENSIPTMGDTLMQFTGLKDKNGKEIYEGDILKWVAGRHWTIMGGSTKTDRFDTVTYEGFGFCPFIHSDGYGGVTTIDVSNCEVIGNIYENPELLK